jgi:hypothetical protein
VRPTMRRKDLHKLSLRQLSVFYHLIHNRLDRPLVGEEYWPECLKILREELYSALLAQKIPESWLKAFLPGRKSEQERAARELYISSLQPLLPAARKEIEEMVKNLEKIESQAQKFWSPYRKRRYLKSELGMIGHWAIKRAWEVYNALNLYPGQYMVGNRDKRQEAGTIVRGKLLHAQHYKKPMEEPIGGSRNESVISRAFNI